MEYPNNQKAIINGTDVIIRTKLAGEGVTVQVWTIDPHEHEERGEKIAEAHSETDPDEAIRAQAIEEAKAVL